MGTQPVQVHQQLANEIAWTPPQRALTQQERDERINQIAERMARGFAEAIVQAQNARPTPFWEKFAIIVVVTLGALLFVAIPGYLLAELAIRSFGL